MTASTRYAAGVAALLCALALVLVLSLAVGANPLSPGVVLDALRGGGDAQAHYVVVGLRVPRTVTGIAAGVALGIAGTLIQAFTRNPLADPGILGVNAGAAFAVAVGVAFLGVRDIAAFVWLAFLGALVVTLAVYVIGSSGRGAADPIRLTLAGVALGAVFSGITTGLALSNPDAFDAMRGWNAGSLLGRDFGVLLPVVPFLVAGAVIAVLVAPGLNALALGDDVARAQGANVRGIRVAVIVAVTLLCGTATALAGPISFVGLMVPHVARRLFGVDQRVILVVSMVLAPTVVLLADVIGRVLIAPAEMPVGIVTAFVGAPVLIALARRARAGAR
ncbi:ABC transporter permease [Paractinoplanes deccanensis]|uniref:ABC transporter permease n=1 Tax=Paractinoplanes deccanensis TaxID=113561 RepID=A0ABQ3XUU1_9ACTN|nr:iron chelate uptake ABC transporter family permease subunit [Actinoplanes deccanensis]GID71514.1 ABC transporter permease [Actinoplanes deccanensis]